MALEINSDIVRGLIDVAREFHARETLAPLEEDSGEISLENAVELHADYGGDTIFQEFRTAVNDLEPDQQQQVVALLWLGRGDFSLDEWEEALEQAQDLWNERTAEYLIGHPQIADYLAEGLALHGYEPE